MFPRQHAKGVTRVRIQCVHCDTTIELTDQQSGDVYCACGKVGLSGPADRPTIHGDKADYRDLSQVQNFQVR